MTEKLSRELAAFLAKPETAQQLRRYGLVHQPMTMAQFNSFVAAESARWKPMIEAAGLAGKGQ